MRVFALVSDAFGGRGGIAKFNRDLLSALCHSPEVERVTTLPRVLLEPVTRTPENLEFLTGGVGGKARFVWSVIRCASQRRDAGLVVCGHLNLLGLAFVARRLLRRLPSGRRPPLVLVIHGIDAWQPTRSAWVNRLAARADVLVSVSEFSRRKFCAWARPQSAAAFILPNCVDLAQFAPGPRRPDLVEHHHLRDRTVLLTVARLSAAERYKGIDQILEALPALLKSITNLKYLIVGDGDDRARLQEKARALGVLAWVEFAGHVPESEKVDYYRLADAFAMPGWGEGFGIVYLEAMACGVPVVGSKLDASQEALLDGRLGTLVNPHEPAELVAGILTALRSRKGVPAGLECFSREQFDLRVRKMISEIVQR